ncbi:NAD-dependent epimerase [Kocuria flava]|uniref:NAD-dependent epimerase n=1 Tax=Kocuria flava TaxID=446860 RepID=A0A0U3GIR1_9MICC|nr:NAD(P)H-binding protein [Kocuria flava]ALU40046.1 NAD-dependent epimerase [Kocuria flava]GEO91531.1 NAD-dependent epimerase [Kocuria flava]
MTRIAVLGGTGYAGSHIVAEAARRGHEVTSYSRTTPAEPVDGVAYVTGSVFDDAFLAQVVAEAEVVIETLSPRGELEGKLEGVMDRLIDRVRAAGVRLGVIGGAGSLRVAEGGPKLMDTEGFPAEILSEVRTGEALLETLRGTEEDLDWFYVSPAGGFGAWAPGEATGRFRIGGDVLLIDEEGNSFISGADLATAVVDEIETPTHSRRRFTVAY